MNKFLFLSLLGLPVLFLWGCSLINNNDSWINTWDLQKISELEQQLSWLLEQFSWLQAENESLKETLSWAVNSLKTLQEENQKLISSQENNKTNNQNNNSILKKQKYSMIDWILYIDKDKLYWNNLKSKNFCHSNLEKRCRYWINIIAENNEYLLFTAIESFYWQTTISYILDKDTNISKAFELWDKLYSFHSFDWEKLYINEYSWRILWWNWAIADKWYYDNYKCDECEIQLIKTNQIHLKDIKNYQTNDVYKLIP
jgi:regulator of replication initiation timing